MKINSKPAKKERKPTNGFDKRPQDINRNGRPKAGTAVTDVIRQMLEDPGGKVEGQKVSKRELLAATLYELAVEDRNLAALKYLIDRTDGTPIQMVDMRTVDESMVDVLSRIHEEKNQGADE